MPIVSVADYRKPSQEMTFFCSTDQKLEIYSVRKYEYHRLIISPFKAQPVWHRAILALSAKTLGRIDLTGTGRANFGG